MSFFDRAIRNHLVLSRAIAILDSRLAERGLRLNCGHDCAEFERDVIPTGKSIGEQMRREFNTIPPSDLFYLTAIDGEGICKAVCAGRLVQLNGWTLARYWREYLSRVYDAKDGSKSELSERQIEIAESFTGVAAYLGELWVHEDRRREGIASDLCQLAQLIAFQKWGPDLVYGFMTDRDVADSGLADRYGWKIKAEKALNWSKPPSAIPEDLWLVANTAEDLRNLSERVSR